MPVPTPDQRHTSKEIVRLVCNEHNKKEHIENIKRKLLHKQSCMVRTINQTKQTLNAPTPGDRHSYILAGWPRRRRV